MKTWIGRICVHPYALTLLNGALFILAYSSLKETWFGVNHSEDHLHSLIHIWEGYGTIVLGFGVVLEERKAIKQVFDIKENDQKLDELTHDYGVIFVMLGLMIEVLAWLVKIPNEVLNTENVELVFLNIAAFFSVVTVILQFRFLLRLLKR